MTGAEDPLSEEKVKPSIFLICPTKNVSNSVSILIEEYIVKKEREGYHVYCPKCDTNPADATGETYTCDIHRQVIENASRIDFWYDPSSEEIQFNLGIAFALKKNIILANKDNDTGFVNPLHGGHFDFDNKRDVVFFSNTYRTLEDYKGMKVVNFRLDPGSKQHLFNFGMAFGLRKPILITNIEEIRPTNDDSFNNVLIALDRQTRGKN